MDAQQFAYWLNGFAELGGDEPPTPGQWKSIKEHLALVFRKVTPPIGAPDWGQQPSLQRPLSTSDPIPHTHWYSTCVGTDDRGDVMVIC